MIRLLICWLGFHWWCDASNITDDLIDSDGDIIQVTRFFYCACCSKTKRIRINTATEHKPKLKVIDPQD